MSDRMRALGRVIMAICHAACYIAPIQPEQEVQRTDRDAPGDDHEAEALPVSPYRPGAPLTAEERAAWIRLVESLLADRSWPSKG
jgi:hypothetical protein